MLGLKCVIDNGDLVAHLLEEGLLTVPAADNVVRLLPPLIDRSQPRRRGADILERACARLAPRRPS
jgi:acetylornithine/N-succinyldiaminopimelate aminotransferase